MTSIEKPEPFYNLVGPDGQSCFEGLPPLAAKNMGKIRAWKLSAPPTA